MAERTMIHGIGQLLVALVNATLVLAALCLWLAWSTLRTAERVSENLALAAQTVAPLRADVTGLTGELGAVREALAARPSEPPDTRAALNDRLQGIEAELQALTRAVGELAETVETAVEQGVTTGFARLERLATDALAKRRESETALPE